MLLFLVTVVKSIKKGFTLESSNINKTMYIGWFVVFIYSMLTTYWSGMGLTPLAGSLSLFFGFICFLLADHYIPKHKNSYLLGSRILLIIMLFQLSMNMLQVQSMQLDYYSFKTYSNTLMGNSNYLSFYFSFFLLYELIAKNKRWIIYSLLSLIGLLLTISRGAIIALALTLVVYFLISLINRQMSKIKALFTLIFILIGFSVFTNYTNVGKEFWFSLQYGLEATSVGAREQLWAEARNVISNNPFGIGVIWRDDPHNIFFSAYRSLGVLVGTLYLFLLSFPLLYFINPKIVRYSNKALALLIAYLSIFIHSMVEIFYFTSASIIWTVITLSFISKTMREEMKAINSKTNDSIQPKETLVKKRLLKRITW